MRDGSTPHLLLLLTAPAPQATTPACFPSGGSIGLPYAAPLLSPGPDRLRLLTTEAWLRDGTFYVVMPSGDSALHTRLTIRNGKPTLVGGRAAGRRSPSLLREAG